MLYFNCAENAFLLPKFTPKTKYARKYAKKKSDFYNQWLHKHTFKGEKRKYIINIDVLVSEGLRVKI